MLFDIICILVYVLHFEPLSRYFSSFVSFAHAECKFDVTYIERKPVKMRRKYHSDEMYKG